MPSSACRRRSGDRSSVLRFSVKPVIDCKRGAEFVADRRDELRLRVVRPLRRLASQFCDVAGFAFARRAVVGDGDRGEVGEATDQFAFVLVGFVWSAVVDGERADDPRLRPDRARPARCRCRARRPAHETAPTEDRDATSTATTCLPQVHRCPTRACERTGLQSVDRRPSRHAAASAPHRAGAPRHRRAAGPNTGSRGSVPRERRRCPRARRRAGRPLASCSITDVCRSSTVGCLVAREHAPLSHLSHRYPTALTVRQPPRSTTDRPRPSDAGDTRARSRSPGVCHPSPLDHTAASSSSRVQARRGWSTK